MMKAVDKSAALIIEQAQREILNEGKLDVHLLDQVVTLFNRGCGEEQRAANQILVTLKEDPNSWSKVDVILECSSIIESKYFALQILEGQITTKWKSLPTEQREGIKTFIVKMILTISENEAEMGSNKLFLDKLNLVLVQIVKQEWPNNWVQFIPELVVSAQSKESVCVNNMNILALLSEEVFDFGSQNLTQAKEQHLKQKFCGQFQEVFHLCLQILEKCPQPAMVHATLKTLNRFLSWIPVGYVFETDVTDHLCNNFLVTADYRVLALQCLTEISCIGMDGECDAYHEKLKQMFYRTIDQVFKLMGGDLNLAYAYKNGPEADQKFIYALAQFLVAFLREHAKLVEVEKPKNEEERKYQELHSYSIKLLLNISTVDEVEVFKVCLDYWCHLCTELYNLSPFTASATPMTFMNLVNPIKEPARRELYKEHLSDLRTIIISKMAKPEEVLVVENDQGEVVREMVKDTDSITLYRNMRETLVYLTHLDCKDTESKMTEKLSTQVNGSDFSWKNLNTLCWAIGSISGTMLEDDEKRFLVLVIRDLLGLCEQKRGKDNKAVIASNIMYVVGQYPRFLRAHWKFLKTVINKLFEFMHESHEGVQDMACDTFIKIAIKCKRHFVILQSSEHRPFIEEMLINLKATICDLTPPQVHVFYEAVGHIISAQMDASEQERLISDLMTMPNNAWDEIITLATDKVEILDDPEIVRNLANILKTNTAACKSIGASFFCQLSKIYMDLLSLYRILSENLSMCVTNRGEDVLKLPVVKHIRAVKKEILILISTWISKTGEQQHNMILENFIPPLFDAVLFDYQKNVPQAREPKVLSLLSIIITQLQENICPEVTKILAAVFECTLEMINKDMEGFPEHRTNFFQLLFSLMAECFPVMIELPETDFTRIIDAVVWAFQHSMRSVSEIGLEILKVMLEKVDTVSDGIRQVFYQRHFMQILNHVLATAADSNLVHVAGLTYYAEVLGALFQAAEFKIHVPLNAENPAQGNMDYIFEHIATTFIRAYPNLTEDQVRVITKGFFSFNSDIGAMKNHLRDFLVQLKEFNGQDTADLFLEEREAEIALAQSRKQAIPGMANPHCMEDESDEMK